MQTQSIILCSFKNRIINIELTIKIRNSQDSIINSNKYRDLDKKRKKIELKNTE